MEYLDILVTLLIAALSGMGIGSGGLLVLYLTFIRGYDQLPAQGLNLLFFLFASFAAMSIHLSRRHIRFGAVAAMILSGLPGAYLGTQVALLLPGDWTRRIFGGFLLFAGLYSLLSSHRAKDAKKVGKFPKKI